MKYKRFVKLMGFIRDNTFEKGDVEGVMDLTEIEDVLNELYEDNKQKLEEVVLQFKEQIIKELEKMKGNDNETL